MDVGESWWSCFFDAQQTVSVPYGMETEKATRCIFEQMADHLIAHGVTVQEWISTDERMPTEDDATDGYVAVVYDGEKTTSLVDVVIAHPDLYDYWMPLNLPQPPKGE